MLPRVTVGIASYLGRAWIERPLEALSRQTLDPAQFEVLVVVNGPDDGTAGLLAQRSGESPFDLRVVRTATASVPAARNLALWAARGEYLVWLDDDDSISAGFLENMLALARPDRVVLPIFGDLAEDELAGLPGFNNYINKSVLRWVGQTCTFADLHTAAAFDGGKMVSTEVARSVQYDLSLSSGSDVLYWTELILKNDLKLTIPSIAGAGIYYRTMRSGSVSRTLSETFLEDRFHCVSGLQALRSRNPQADLPVARLLGGQAANLGSWLRQHPGRRSEVMDRVAAMRIDDFPYGPINHESAEKLVVSYAFPPVMDTSGLVAARRLLLADEPYDVVTNTMKGLRQLDPGTELLVGKQLGRRHLIDGKPVSSHMPAIERFTNLALGRLADRHARRGAYQQLYSRSMWPAAHVMAAAYKLKHPETEWTAEFSDPLLVDVVGQHRFKELPPTPFAAQITAAAQAAGFDIPATNFWEWVESFTFALADKILFTNPHQLELMREHAANAQLVERVDQVAQIAPHPTLPAQYYSLAPSDYQLDPDLINIGYFGVFYASRGAGDVFRALQHAPEKVRSRVRLHIFTDRPDDTLTEVRKAGAERCVQVNPYVPYLEFLNLTTRLDWLLVADARAAHTHGVNPYIPSKYSDYLGSGSKIWALVESGSMLSQARVEAATELGDLDAAASLLASMVS